jgi:hypothetical protein
MITEDKINVSVLKSAFKQKNAFVNGELMYTSFLDATKNLLKIEYGYTADKQVRLNQIEEVEQFYKDLIKFVNTFI